MYLMKRLMKVLLLTKLTKRVLLCAQGVHLMKRLLKMLLLTKLTKRLLLSARGMHLMKCLMKMLLLIKCFAVNGAFKPFAVNVR